MINQSTTKETDTGLRPTTGPLMLTLEGQYHKYIYTLYTGCLQIWQNEIPGVFQVFQTP